MASWEGAQQGASMGAATGNPWLALGGGLLGALFSKGPQYSPMQKLQMQIAQQLQQYANGVPLSSPDEAAALAQQRALLGGEQQQATNQILGSLNPNATAGQADMMKNLASSQAGERGALDIEALMKSLQQHRQALLQSAQVAGGVGAPQTPARGQDLPEMFGQLAYQYAQQRAMKQNMPMGQNTQGMAPGGFFVNTPQPPGPHSFTLGRAPASAPAPSPASGLLGAFGRMIGGQIGGAQSLPGAAGGSAAPDTLQPPAAGYRGDYLGRRLRGLG